MRAEAIRNLVLRNLHHDVKCQCKAYTPKSLDALRKETTSGDVRALMLLLVDPPSAGPFAVPARDLLAEYGDESLPLVKEASMSRDESTSAAALAVVFQIEARRGGDARRTVRELADARAREIGEALPRANAAALELVRNSVSKAAPECQSRSDSPDPWMDWTCGAGDLRAGVAEFASADAASRYLSRTRLTWGVASPFVGVGEESGVSDWKEPKAGAWTGGSFVAVRRGVFVVTFEARAIAEGLASGEVDRAPARTRAVARELDAALARGSAALEEP